MRRQLILSIFLSLILLAGASAPAAAAVWYVNDADTSGDVWCSAPGSGANSGTTAGDPYLEPDSAAAAAAIGDTIIIDRGIYDSVAITLTADSINLIGADSTATLLNIRAGSNGVMASNRSGLLIRGLGFSGAQAGFASINFTTTVNSRIEACRSVYSANHGFYLFNGSSGNLVINNLCETHAGSGILLHTGSNNNTVTGNRVSNSQTDGGIYLVGSNNVYVVGNTVDGSSKGVNLFNSDSCTVFENILTGNQSAIYLQNGTDSAVIAGNDLIGSANYGIYIDGTANAGNRFAENAVVASQSYALYALSGSNQFIDNEFHDNLNGIYLTGNNGTLVQNNRIANNAGTGLELFGTQTVVAQLNDFDSNGNYQILVSGAATTVSVPFNNIRCSPGYPDSGLSNPAGATVSATRCWWFTGDSTAIAPRISGMLVNFTPWRLGLIDTAVGADTVAPAAPDTVVALPVDSTTIALSWAEANGNELDSNPLTDLAGYHIWRLAANDTQWQSLLEVGPVTQFLDTGLVPATRYRYQVMAFDNHSPWRNESWSDTIADTYTVDPTAGPNDWYVNDTDASGDQFCTATGSDSFSGLSPDKPLATLAMVLAQLTPGDTVLIDVGNYYGHWQIDTPYVTVIGVDSATTILHATGSFDGLTLNGCTGAQLTGFKVVDAAGGFNNIMLNLSPQAILNEVAVSGAGLAGIRLQGGSSAVAISNCVALYNAGPGVSVNNSPGVQVYALTAVGNNYGIAGIGSVYLNIDGCLLDSNSQNGVDLPAGCDSATIDSNRITGNGNCGISGAPGGVIRDNVITGNGQKGIDAGQGARISGNLLAGNGYGLAVLTNNVIADRNEFGANQLAGILLSGTPSGFFAQRNNLAGGDTAVECNASGSHNLTRNWWGTTDSAILSARITGGMSWNAQYLPYRSYPIDTAPGEDTYAPATPDTTVAYGLDTGTVRIAWAAVTQNEDSSGACGDLSGYSILRRQQGDTVWAPLTSTGPGTLFFDDTGVASGVIYWYAVTAFDAATPYPNVSWMSAETQAMALVDTAAANAWYVNDASLINDVYALAVGNDGNAGSSPALPKLTVAAALALAGPGDTIYIDVGNYTETISVTVSSLALVGADSVMTALGMISIDTASAVYVGNLSAGYAVYGLRLQNASNCLIDKVQAIWCQTGFALLGGSNNRLQNCQAMDNGSGALLLGSSGNTLLGNTFNLSSGHGLLLLPGSNNNLVQENAATSNTADGFQVAGTGNVLYGNRALNNSQNGFTDSGSAGTLYTQNYTFNNSSNQFRRSGSGTPLYRKNIIWSGNGGFLNEDSSAVDVRWNYWYAGDSASITTRRSGVGAAAIMVAPFLVYEVDTRVGEDTVAHAPVTGLLAAGIGNGVDLVWDAVTTDEHGNPATDPDDYRIYRGTAEIGPYSLLAATGGTNYTDTTANHASLYYYTVTARDNHSPVPNESVYSAVTPGVKANWAPVAVIGGDTQSGQQYLPLTAASSTDSDADAKNYYWWLAGGSTGSFTDTTSLTTGFTGMTVCTQYTFGLTVSDSWGGADTAYLVVDVHDSTPPDTPALVIAGGAAYTNSETVWVTLTYTGDTLAIYMKFDTMTSAMNNGAWEINTWVQQVALDAGADGVKYVYGVTGNELFVKSGVASDSIILDRQAPLNPQIMGNATPNSVVIAADTVSLSFSAGEATNALRNRISKYADFSGAQWQNWVDSFVYTLSAGETTVVLYLAAQDSAGNESYDSLIVTTTDTSYLYALPPSGLYAWLQVDNSVYLNWWNSPTPGADTYSVYSDSGTPGTIDYVTPLAVLHMAYDTTLSGFSGDTFYTFAVRATDAMGEEKNTHVMTSVYIPAGVVVRALYAYITDPMPGLRVAGDQLLVYADIYGGDSLGATVTFKYRPYGTVGWTTIGSATDPQPLYVNWDLTWIPDGDYELTASAANGGDVDSWPATVFITKDQYNADIFNGTNDSGYYEAIEPFYEVPGETLDFRAIDDALGMFWVEFPPDALDLDTGERTSISMMIVDNWDLGYAGLSDTGYDTGGAVIELDLANGDTQFTDTVYLRIPYQDDNPADGVIDGTWVRVTLARIMYFNEQTQLWELIDTNNVTIDPVNKVFIVATTHFSKFATGKTNTQGDLGAGDGNGNIPDGTVDQNDLRIFGGQWRRQSNQAGFDSRADLVPDNRINEEDLFEFGRRYGTSQ